MRKSDWQRMEGRERERERERDGEAQRQYYLAVDRQQFKMGTLVDLLDVIGRRSGLPIVLCCSSRDGLDDVCANLSSLPYISISCVHSDLTEAERSVCLEKFRQAALEWMLKHDVESQGNEEDLKKQSSHVLVMTDSCLPMQTIGEAPVSAQVLINYDLPAKKEAYLRRLAACMPAIHISNSNKVTGATIPTMAATSTSTTNLSHNNSILGQGGLVINMVVGGEIVNLRNIEEGCSIIIEEMPIHISELL